MSSTGVYSTALYDNIVYCNIRIMKHYHCVNTRIFDGQSYAGVEVAHVAVCENGFPTNSVTIRK